MVVDTKLAVKKDAQCPKFMAGMAASRMKECTVPPLNLA
jgi:hypothetical protein